MKQYLKRSCPEPTPLTKFDIIKKSYSLYEQNLLENYRVFYATFIYSSGGLKKSNELGNLWALSVKVSKIVERIV